MVVDGHPTSQVRTHVAAGAATMVAGPLIGPSSRAFGTGPVVTVTHWAEVATTMYWGQGGHAPFEAGRRVASAAR